MVYQPSPLLSGFASTRGSSPSTGSVTELTLPYGSNASPSVMVGLSLEMKGTASVERAITRGIYCR